MALAEELAERQVLRHRVVAAAIDEVHRHVECPVGVGVEHVLAAKHEGQETGARVVGVAPDPRAVALEAADLLVDDRRCGPQRGQDRGHRVEAFELRRRVRFILEVEVRLHRRGAHHHVEAARADGGHVRAHHVVALLRHPRDVFADAERAQPDGEPGDAEIARGAAKRIDVLLEIVQQLAIVIERARGELELAAGLDRDLRIAANQRDDVPVLDHRSALVPALAGCATVLEEPAQQRTDPAIAGVRGCGAGLRPDADQLVLAADAPGRPWLPRAREVLEQLGLRPDRNRVLFVDEMHELPDSRG